MVTDGNGTFMMINYVMLTDHDCFMLKQQLIMFDSRAMMII